MPAVHLSGERAAPGRKSWKRGLLERGRLMYINRQALQLPQFLPAVAMQYHCQAVASLSILQFEFDFIACNDSTAQFTATLSAANGPQPFELGFRQAATSQ
jgi:hypothetical protein